MIKFMGKFLKPGNSNLPYSICKMACSIFSLYIFFLLLISILFGDLYFCTIYSGLKCSYWQ